MPYVSVLLAVHNDADFLAEAVESVLRQTMTDLELLVVDDASTDETAVILSGVSDPRLRVLRNERRLGLAASLNLGIGAAGGRYLARLDADDVALPRRLEYQLARIAEPDQPAILGSAVLDIDRTGEPGTLHRNPSGPRGIRWHALFGSPFFHPTVVIDRERVEPSWLRYDPSFLESEDYDLWTRLLLSLDGANLTQPLVLKRVHGGQASVRRGELQSSFQRQVALREIARVASDLTAEERPTGNCYGATARTGRRLLRPTSCSWRNSNATTESTARPVMQRYGRCSPRARLRRLCDSASRTPAGWPFGGPGDVYARFALVLESRRGWRSSTPHAK